MWKAQRFADHIDFIFILFFSLIFPLKALQLEGKVEEGKGDNNADDVLKKIELRFSDYLGLWYLRECS